MVVSPDEMNRVLNTVIVAPMTSSIRPYPTRAHTTFQRRKGSIALDQIRAVDKRRLYKKLGTIHPGTAAKAVGTLTDMFGQYSDATGAKWEPACRNHRALMRNGVFLEGSDASLSALTRCLLHAPVHEGRR